MATTPTGDEIRQSVAAAYGSRVRPVLERADTIPLTLIGSSASCCGPDDESCAVDAEGRPLPGVELRRADGSSAGVANERGVHAGVMVESVFTCPDGRTKETAVVLHRDGRTRELPVRELRGDVRW